jgi:hypothetical protein
MLALSSERICGQKELDNIHCTKELACMVCRCIERNVVKLMPLTDPRHRSEHGRKNDINTNGILRHAMALIVGKPSSHGGAVHES